MKKMDFLKNHINIQFAHELPEERWWDIAVETHRVAHLETTILERSLSFYLKQIQKETFVIALHKDQLIGTTMLFHLSPRHAEITGSWVHPNFRQKGIHSEMKARLCQLALQQNLTVVSTNKSPHPEQAGSLLSNSKHNIFPVSYRYLKFHDFKAFKACCCCDETHNYHHCEYADHSCILTLETHSPQEVYAVKQFLASNSWETSNVPMSVKKKIEKRWEKVDQTYSNIIAIEPRPSKNGQLIPQ